jgi:hypothetical protein
LLLLLLERIKWSESDFGCCCFSSTLEHPLDNIIFISYDDDNFPIGYLSYFIFVRLCLFASEILYIFFIGIPFYINIFFMPFLFIDC